MFRINEPVQDVQEEDEQHPPVEEQKEINPYSEDKNTTPTPGPDRLIDPYSAGS